MLRRSFRQAGPCCPRPTLLSAVAGREGTIRAAPVALTSTQRRGQATAPVSATLREAKKKLINNRLGGMERLNADETYEVLQDRFNTYGRIRSGFVTNLFHKAQTPAHLDRAMDAFYYAQSQLVEPNQAMIWELQNACVRIGEPKRALELYASVHKIRVWPTARQFNRLMNHFLESGDVDSALATYAALRKRKVEPDARTFGLVLRAHALKGDLDQALATAEQAKRALNADALPSPVADALMGVYWTAKNMDGLWSLAKEQASGDTARSLDGALYVALAHLQANNVSAAADMVRATLSQPTTPEQFETWADSLAKEATSANLAQPAATLLRALKDGPAPTEAHARLDDLAAQLDAVVPAAQEEPAEEAPTAEEEKKEEAQA